MAPWRYWKWREGRNRYTRNGRLVYTTRMSRSRRPSNQTPRVLAYTRVSTLEQARSGHGLEAQRQTIQQEAQRRGWKQLQIVEDDGWSAKDLKRPGIQQALELLASGEADTLILRNADPFDRCDLPMSPPKVWTALATV